MICERFEHTPDSVVVSWLPVYHDMGLIGMLFQPLYVGNPCILMSPVAFMQRPIRWLQAISRYRATTSGGPNFAYEMCVDRIKNDDCAGLDLSSLEIAYSGAEPVRADTMRRFSERFAPYGFRREAFYPCYGLAEATLLVTGGRKLSPWRVRTVDADALESDHRAVAARDNGHRRTLVGCGTSPACQSVRIVHPETCEELGEGHVGEIWVAGPCVAGGYWKREQ
jgi:acyl-CoA synthetase (AMP-forming)/AMP-acid ligase II